MKAKAAVISLFLFLFLASTAFAQFTRHHVGTAAGYFRITDDQFENPFTGLNLRNNGIGSLNYRYSISPSMDLVLEVRQTVGRDSFDVNFFPGYSGIQFIPVRGKLTHTLFGAGFRFNVPVSGFRPYIQGNLYFVRQKLEVERFNVVANDHHSTLGVGASAGLEIFVSGLISIPLGLDFIHAAYMEGARYTLASDGGVFGYIPYVGNNISGIGLSAGINFNFGRSHQP